MKVLLSISKGAESRGKNRDHGYGKSVPLADASGTSWSLLIKCMKFLGIDLIILPSRHGGTIGDTSQNLKKSTLELNCLHSVTRLGAL